MTPAIVEPLYTNYPPSSLLSCSNELSYTDVYPHTTQKISLYIHIPFCKSTCTFCHLLMFASNDNNLMEKYTLALTKEIRLVREKLRSQPTIDAILFGGGTPSYLDPTQINAILRSVEADFCLASSCEITLECHPQTLTDEKLEKFYSFGINRLSIGIQSFDTSVLRSCGRRYSYDYVSEVIKQAHKIGYKNINIDLMLGLPKQTISSVKDTCVKVLSLIPQQISIYPVTIGEKSILRQQVLRKMVKLPTETEKSAMYNAMYQAFHDSGYELPTVNNFVKARNFTNKYAVNNWTSMVDRIGIGIGAYSYCDNHQYRNHKDLDSYFACIEKQRVPIGQTMFVSPDELFRRKIIFQLQNVTLEDVAFVSKIKSLYGKKLKNLEKKGLIRLMANKIELTYSGIKYLYYVQREFFSTHVIEALRDIGSLK